METIPAPTLPSVEHLSGKNEKAALASNRPYEVITVPSSPNEYHAHSSELLMGYANGGASK